MTWTQPTSEFFATPYYDEAGHVTCIMVVVVGVHGGSSPVVLGGRSRVVPQGLSGSEFGAGTLSLSLSSATPKCINERVDLCLSTCILLYAADTVSLYYPNPTIIFIP